MRDDLIIDVGLNDGRDTAYYLHRGYRVVAIDANPRWIEEGKWRFSAEIESGRLVLLNVGIAFERTRARMYYSEHDLGVASLSASHVTALHPVTDSFEVDCIPFDDVLREYGVPYYLKVDIESLDRACLIALNPDRRPTYVSWEEGEDALVNLAHLHSIGYESFKLINQVTFRELSRENSIWNRARYRINRALGRSEKHRRTNDGWEFRAGCTGPFGRDLDGRWRSYDAILAQWNELCRRYPRSTRRGGWHDFHAWREGTL